MPTNNVWKQNVERREGFDFETPSGQLCRMRPANLEELIIDGLIDDIDAVTKVVQSEIITRKRNGAKRTEEESWAEGLKFIGSDAGKTAINLMNEVVPRVVIEPTVLPDPPAGTPRDPDAIYVTDIGLEDRAAIFAKSMEKVESTATFRK